MEKPSTTLRILIVDADERQAAAVSRGLRELGVADVLAVTSGCAARAALERTEYDLLVADSALGDGQALALVRETQARWPSTVTILVVDCEQAQAESALEGGPAHHYVEKPFALHQLTDVIECLLSADGIPDPGARLVLKAVLGGDAQVGKTTLMQRLRTGRFQPDRAMTIGVDFHTYDTAVGDRSTRVVVWDLGGQERFSCTRRAFYRGARAVGLVFDLGNRNSFYNLTRWWRETREYLPNAPMLLLANKIDLPRQVSTDEMLRVSQAWSAPLYTSSCANGQGVREFFEALAAAAARTTLNAPSH